MEDAIKKFPEIKEYDHDFDPKQHKQELEVLQLSMTVFGTDLQIPDLSLLFYIYIALG